jgi:hypothetical protein
VNHIFVNRGVSAAGRVLAVSLVPSAPCSRAEPVVQQFCAALLLAPSIFDTLFLDIMTSS